MTEPVAWPPRRRQLVAILRGIQPDEAVELGQVLVEAGFDTLEIPLNSPEPLDSIQRLAAALPSHVLLGAGTVLSAERVAAVYEAGARLLISPNFDPAVVAAAARLGMPSMPGVFTPTEAFAALAAGAAALKFFPASMVGAEGIGAMRAVLPRGTVLGAVGGVSEASFTAYAQAGVTVFGLGSSLYKPGFRPADLRERALAAVTAYDAVFPQVPPAGGRGQR